MRIRLRSLAISSLVLTFASAAGARTRPHYGGTVRVESGGSSVSAERAITASLVAETLTSVDAMGRVQPLLAERWESQNGGRRWQFWIRQNIRLHDGSILSAADAAQIFSSQQGSLWRTVRANGSAVILECDTPQPLLPALLASQQFAISKTDSSGLLIGTGPFRRASSSGATTKLTAFDDYWQGRPYVDAIDLSAGRGVRDQWMDLSVARADLVDVPAVQIRRAEQERMRVLASQNMELIALVPSPNSQLLQDVRMRQAISVAIDRNALLNVIFQRQGEVAAGILPNWMTGYDFLFAAPQDTNLARDLHGQARQSGAITISYESGDGIQQLLADRVVLNARDAGIAMQAVPRHADTQADLGLVRVSMASLNPGVALQQITSSILPGNASTAEADPNSLFRNERDLLTSYRVIPLLYVPRAFAASPRVRNWTLDVDGAPSLTEAWVEDPR